MKTVDCYDLLTRDQREQIADMMMEAMAFHNIYPDKLDAIYYSVRKKLTNLLEAD